MGSIVLELKSGGKGNFTYPGAIADCAYSTSRKQVNGKCKGDAGATMFTFKMTAHSLAEREALYRRCESRNEEGSFFHGLCA